MFEKKIKRSSAGWYLQLSKRVYLLKPKRNQYVNDNIVPMSESTRIERVKFEMIESAKSQCKLLNIIKISMKGLNAKTCNKIGKWLDA